MSLAVPPSTPAVARRAGLGAVALVILLLVRTPVMVADAAPGRPVDRDRHVPDQGGLVRRTCPRLGAEGRSDPVRGHRPGVQPGNAKHPLPARGLESLDAPAAGMAIPESTTIDEVTEPVQLDDVPFDATRKINDDLECMGSVHDAQRADHHGGRHPVDHLHHRPGGLCRVRNPLPDRVHRQDDLGAVEDDARGRSTQDRRPLVPHTDPHARRQDPHHRRHRADRRTEAARDIRGGRPDDRVVRPRNGGAEAAVWCGQDSGGHSRR